MQKKNLLIINSSHVLMDITKRILERAGYSVRCAIGLRGAREQLEDFSPDGIILTKELPDGNGFTFLQELQGKNGARVLFLSNDREDELPALNAGASEFLKRPYDHDVLLARLSMMLIDDKTGSAKERRMWNAGEAYAAPQPEQASQPAGLAGLERNIGARRQKLTSMTRYLIITAACLAIVIIGAVIFINFYNKASAEIVIDSAVPMAEFPFSTVAGGGQTDKPPIQIIEIPVIDNLTIRTGETDLDLLLMNPSKNCCEFLFELMLENPEETLYTSNMVDPGQHAGAVSISRALEKGMYDGILRIHTYDPVNMIRTGNIDIDIVISVK